MSNSGTPWTAAWPGFPVLHCLLSLLRFMSIESVMPSSPLILCRPLYPLYYSSASLVASVQCGRPGFDPWVVKNPWSKAWQPTPVFLCGESPWTEEPGNLWSLGSQRVRHDWVSKHSTEMVRKGFCETVTNQNWRVKMNEPNEEVRKRQFRGRRRRNEGQRYFKAL